MGFEEGAKIRQKEVKILSPKEKRIKNLGTYAIIMVLATILIIILAAMADNREELFEKQIDQQTQTNMSMQNEVLRISDENYRLTKENEELLKSNQNLTTSNTFYKTVAEAWELYYQNNISGAEEKISTINMVDLKEEEKTSYNILLKAIKKGR